MCTFLSARVKRLGKGPARVNIEGLGCFRESSILKLHVFGCVWLRYIKLQQWKSVSDGAF